MIPVTKPYFPKRAEYKKYVDLIWNNQWITNNGPLLKEFEVALASYLGTNRPVVVANGTLALQLAIKALELKGEIITTPFSYVASTSSIVWEGCVPRFADIDTETLNIDPLKIEAEINANTSAILATHCFGNACDIEGIDAIARAHGLPVIYDASHCFGTTYRGKSIFEYGDISTCSLHATKIMHCVEGGTVFTRHKDIYEKLGFLRNFGHDGYEEFNGLGINAKNSEMHAAMGMCVLHYQDTLHARRKEQCELYDELLTELAAYTPKVDNACNPNRAYYPLVFDTEKACLKAKDALEEQQVFGRRYFYPSLNTLPYLAPQNVPNAVDISKRILCIPLYHELKPSEQQMICKVLLNTNYD